MPTADITIGKPSGSLTSTLAWMRADPSFRNSFDDLIASADNPAIVVRGVWMMRSRELFRCAVRAERRAYSAVSRTSHPSVRRSRAPVIALLATLAAAQSADAEDFPEWAFPSNPQTASSATDHALLTVPGSRIQLHADDVNNISNPPDWFPQEHPALPVPVGSARTANRFACGFCHLPDGLGRPENASLAGLPAAYIRSQADAFRKGERRSARPDWKPTMYMIDVAKDATDVETARAAEYFSQRHFASHVKIIESKIVPAHVPKGFIHALAPGCSETLGQQIIEMPTDIERFERRDPHSRFVAYVPVGSLARGDELARAGATPCAACHGAGLKGGAAAMAPPLAGRSPTYLFRQLYGFRTGARTAADAQPMRDVAERLTQSDMIALAAYVASLKP